jgi:sugar/nucleoside kinase (ribokinase family)
MTELVNAADILITTEEDTERVFGIKAASCEEVARILAKQFHLETAAITLREIPVED